MSEPSDKKPKGLTLRLENPIQSDMPRDGQGLYLAPLEARSDRRWPQISTSHDLWATLLQGVHDEMGPTYAVVCTPDRTGDFQTQAYMFGRLMDRKAAALLLPHLGRVASPKIRRQSGPLHLTSDAAIQGWLGADGLWLEGMQVAAWPLRSGEKMSATLLLFRDADRPFKTLSILNLFDITQNIATRWT